MFEMSILGLQISIDLQPGIYLMGNTSAVGKSRLGMLLEKGFLLVVIPIIILMQIL